MSIVRVAKRDNFTVLRNEALNDERLSFRARGVLAWLLSKPPEWTADSVAISGHGTEGRDAVRAAMKELETCGYLRREKQHLENGQFVSVSWVYEAPAPGNPASVDQASVDQAVSNKELSERTERKKDAAAPPEPSLERALAQEVVIEWWESLSKKPSTGMIAFVKLGERLLVKGWTQDELRAGIKASAFRTKDLEAWKRGRAAEPVINPTAVDPSIVRAWAEIEPWVLSKGERGRLLIDNKSRVLPALVTLKRWGYGVGESLIRLAVAIRYAPDYALCWDPKYLADDQHRVVRFEGSVLDEFAAGSKHLSLVECMERAYSNQRWGK